MSQFSRIQGPKEERECHRLSCRTPVRIYADPTSASDSFFLESSNLSPEGVFLHTEFLFPVGEWLDLEFVMPGRAQPVRAKGQVVRVNDTYEPPGPGVAIHLPHLSSEERSALDSMRSLSV